MAHKITFTTVMPRAWGRGICTNGNPMTFLFDRYGRTRLPGTKFHLLWLQYVALFSVGSVLHAGAGAR
jgi:hypothetical protein